MHVLGNMIESVKSGGLVLDLQVVRPNPIVETGGEALCEIDGEPLFELADAAAAAVHMSIAAGRLVEETVDDHDVRKHYPNGPDLGTRISQAYRIRGAPETFIVDKTGVLRGLIIGPTTQADLQAKIEPLLAQ